MQGQCYQVKNKPFLAYKDSPENLVGHSHSTGVEVFMMIMVHCKSSLGNCTSEGSEQEKGGNANFYNKAHRTFDIIMTWTPVGQTGYILLLCDIF